MNNKKKIVTAVAAASFLVPAASFVIPEVEAHAAETTAEATKIPVGNSKDVFRPATKVKVKNSQRLTAVEKAVVEQGIRDVSAVELSFVTVEDNGDTQIIDDIYREYNIEGKDLVELTAGDPRATVKPENMPATAEEKTAVKAQIADSKLSDEDKKFLTALADEATKGSLEELKKELAEKIAALPIEEIPGDGATVTTEEKPEYKLIEKEEVEVTEIPYKTVEKENAELEKGVRKVTQKGVNGKKTITYKVTLGEENEVLKKEKVSEQEIPATDEIVEVGTKTNKVLVEGTSDVFRPTAKVKVLDLKKLREDEKKAVIANILAVNNSQITVSEVAEDGTATLMDFELGKEYTIKGSDLVEQQEIETEIPGDGAVVELPEEEIKTEVPTDVPTVDQPEYDVNKLDRLLIKGTRDIFRPTAKVGVLDLAKLTEAEKKAVIANILAVNNSQIYVSEVAEDGTATLVDFELGKEYTIEGSDLVEQIITEIPEEYPTVEEKPEGKIEDLLRPTVPGVIGEYYPRPGHPVVEEKPVEQVPQQVIGKKPTTTNKKQAKAGTKVLPNTGLTATTSALGLGVLAIGLALALRKRSK